MTSTREQSRITKDDEDEISLSSDSASDLSQLGAPAQPERPRSLSFDDLYSLAPAQNGLSINSKFAYIPLEGNAPTGIPKSASLDDLQALAEGYADNAEQGDYADDAGADYADDASVMSMPAQGSATRPVVSRRAMSVGDAYDRSEIEEVKEVTGDNTIHQDAPRSRPRPSAPRGAGDAGAADDADDESPAVRLFGKERAQELRERIRKGRNVSRQDADDALNAATAALMGTASTETLEFVTWFSVWLLIIFYLLFYSSYGPMLWRLLYGPMGILLALPFSFALLFWLIRYILSEDDDDDRDE